MGNSSSQVTYKICILGLERSGKTLLCSLLRPQKNVFYTDAFSFFHYQACKNVTLEIWDH